jgi:hypothetical protein
VDRFRGHPQRVSQGREKGIGGRGWML